MLNVPKPTNWILSPAMRASFNAGDKIQIAAKKVAKFKAGAELADAINK